MSSKSAPQTFDDILEKIRRESKSETEKGKMFENLMVEFLSTDSVYSNRFSKVYKWASWPGNKGEPDMGTDLVAEENGKLCAIQCKCYSEDHVLGKNEISNFPADASGKKFHSMILIYTGGSITSNARKLLENHHCQVIGTEELQRSNFDWSKYPKRAVKSPKKLRDYQEQAVNDVITGFKGSDRGKLVMACGTGKTLVALHVAENLVGRNGTVLYLVPSISLIYQSMREWSDNAGTGHYYVAVCSDKSVGEEGSILELECPVSTNPDDLMRNVMNRPKGAMTVIFSTYHSIKVASRALGKKFDLVLCDEAHRTTGVENDSYYTHVHNDRNVLAKRRLYMTATPKIYGETVKGAARGRAIEKKGIEAASSEPAIYSMDDERTYGPVFHRLGFVDAVHKHKALADFKVIVPMVSTKYVDMEFQQAVAKDGAMPLDERTLLAAVWHGIQYPEGEGDPKLLQKVIAFTNRIDRSEIFAGDLEDSDVRKKRSFENVVGEIKTKRPTTSNVEVSHIDGKKNALKRREKMRWLGASDVDPNTCRILSNARCLSEGVDVPALDGVVFLNPRESIVDIVQSVGRVMRRAPGKDTGYVVLPVAIPAGVDTNNALDSHPSYRTVWQVLNALRSHDESLAREINSLILDRGEGESSGDVTPRISFSILGLEGEEKLPMPKLFDKIKSTLIRKVGDVDYYNEYGRKIGKAAAIVEERIETMLDASKSKRRELDEFHESLKSVINDSVTRDEAIRVIAQHVVLARVFDELFSGEFTSHNPISKVLSKMAASFGLDAELEDLEEFYAKVKDEVKLIDSTKARQNFIKTLYENFFKSTAKKETEKHGVVFTPIEVVDFVIHSVQHVLKTRFGMGFDDRRVKVLEPFAGTGTFITRLLDSGLLGDNAYQKYRNDLLANEMILLAYYIATVNIETTYSSGNGGRYVPFEGISYTDTLRQNPRYLSGKEHRGEQATIGGMFRVAHERVRRQRATSVDVIMGNPPYSSRQSNYNDENPNTKYPMLDKRVNDMYIKNTNVHNKNSLYDSYIRALRWASDRIGESGIVAFVTNASFVRSDAAAGIRDSISKEFDEVWCLDLRANQRTQGETRRREGGNIFGVGSRAPVAVTILVKSPRSGGGESSTAKIYYKDIGDYLTREKKLEMIKSFRSIKNINDWTTVFPDIHNDWLDQRDNRFLEYLPMGSKSAKAGKTNAIFQTYSLGIITKRDIWAYNTSRDELFNNMRKHIKYCNAQNLDNPVIDSRYAKWSTELGNNLKIHKPEFDINNIRTALYRPFFKQKIYFDKTYNGAIHQIPRMFPTDMSKNLVICVPYKFIGEFSVIITDTMPDLHIVNSNQCFPLYTYNKNTKIDNITEYSVQEYKGHYENERINKNDVFYYIYGMLHHSGYRGKFANNLAKDLPNIPMAPDFKKFSQAGKKLADLHLNFETCKRFNLGRPNEKFGKPAKVAFGRIGMKADKTKIRINNVIVFEDIPQPKYTVNGRTPLEWVVDRYNRTVDKDSHIVNNPLEGMDEDDIIAVIERAVHVGAESDRIIATLPDEFEPRDWKPKKTGLDAHIGA